MTNETVERFRRLEELFHAALDLPAGPEREAFLRDREGAGPGLVEEVRNLIQNLGKVRTAAPDAPEVLPRFGAWQVIRLLGRGGGFHQVVVLVGQVVVLVDCPVALGCQILNLG